MNEDPKHTAGNLATEDAPAAPGATPPDDPFEAMRAADPEMAEALREEWGDDFDRQIELARDAVRTLADSGIVEMLERTGIGDDPRLVRLAARIGALLQGSDSEETTVSGTERDALEDELDRLVKSGDYWSDRVQKRVRQIYLKLYGEGARPDASPGAAAGAA